MLIQVSTPSLASALAKLVKIVPSTTPIPILHYVLIEAKDDGIILSTTDTHLSISTRCLGEVQQPGTLTVPIRRLKDIVAEISTDELTIASQEGKARISGGAFKTDLASLPASDFPSLPSMPTDGVLVDGSVLRRMAKQVQPCGAVEDARYFMNGALLEMEGGAMCMVATDGKRLGKASGTYAGPDRQSLLLNMRTVAAVLTEDAEDFMVATTENHAFFATEHTVVSALQIEGRFPDYKRILPLGHGLVAQVARLDLLAAIRRVALISGDAKAVKISFEVGRLDLYAASADGVADESVPAEYDGDPLTVTMNWIYLRDFLDAAIGVTITLKLKDASASVLCEDGTEFLAVIMGMRV